MKKLISLLCAIACFTIAGINYAAASFLDLSVLKTRDMFSYSEDQKEWTYYRYVTPTMDNGLSIRLYLVEWGNEE